MSSTDNRSLLPDSSRDRIREQVQTGLESVKHQLASTGRTIRDETMATGHVLKEEVASVASEKLEQARLGTADTLARAARGVEGHANDSSSPRIRKVASDISHRLQDASQYVRTKSYSDAAEDVREDIRAHPGRWLCAALSVGFVTGVCFHALANRQDSRRSMIV
jgi:hypothetical protein